MKKKTKLVLGTLAGALLIQNLYKRRCEMLILTKDNVVVLAWVTAVELMGYDIEQVPTRWGLRALVEEVLNERKEEQ